MLGKVLNCKYCTQVHMNKKFLKLSLSILISFVVVVVVVFPVHFFSWIYFQGLYLQTFLVNFSIAMWMLRRLRSTFMILYFLKNLNSSIKSFENVVNYLCIIKIPILLSVEWKKKNIKIIFWWPPFMKDQFFKLLKDI